MGLTINSEVNLLAAQMTRESFLIPENYVVLSKNKDGAGIDTLETIKASSLFAMRVKLEDWILKILNHEYVEKQEKIRNKINSREWVKKTNEALLPIIVKGIDGSKRPFRYDDVIELNETIIYLQ